MPVFQSHWPMHACNANLILRVQVDGMTIIVENIVGSTGLELKVDPGVPYVYAGFAGIRMLVFP